MMDKRINRFRICDIRFYPYLARVFQRLPEEIKEDVLDDESFQLLTDDDIFEASVLRYDFHHPVESLVYLNTKILMEPSHQIIHTIASEIAHYVLKKEGTRVWERMIDELLIEWGFGKEIEAVRYDEAISESKGYKTGYEWAKKQSQDYLMQHFGLYFDEWNDKGLGRMSSEGFDKLNHRAETDSILDKMMELKKGHSLESEKGDTSEALSLRKAMLAGIMTAAKELRLHDLYDPKNSAARYTSIKHV
jgi:hypothetical protein